MKPKPDNSELRDKLENMTGEYADLHEDYCMLLTEYADDGCTCAMQGLVNQIIQLIESEKAEGQRDLIWRLKKKGQSAKFYPLESLVVGNGHLRVELDNLPNPNKSKGD